MGLDRAHTAQTSNQCHLPGKERPSKKHLATLRQTTSKYVTPGVILRLWPRTEDSGELLLMAHTPTRVMISNVMFFAALISVLVCKKKKKNSDENVHHLLGVSHTAGFQ